VSNDAIQTTLVLAIDELQRPSWESAGGIFILHTSAVSSIAHLKVLGFE
jgi:hypothetical protein